MLLDQGRAVGAKVLKDYMEVLGYGEAARWVYGQALDVPGFLVDWLAKVTEVGRGVSSGAIGLRSLPLVLAENPQFVRADPSFHRWRDHELAHRLNAQIGMIEDRLLGPEDEGN